MNSEYPLYDGAGSERTVSAANQSVSGTITFEGFGQTIATTGSSSNPYMFKGGFGYRNDGDAGPHHVGAIEMIVAGAGRRGPLRDLGISFARRGGDFSAFPGFRRGRGH